MGRRWRIVKWCVQQGFTGWQNVGELLTLHRQPENGEIRFQAAFVLSVRIGSLKPLQNLQLMECRRFTDILPARKALLNKAFGDEPSPLHFKFQAAVGDFAKVSA